MILIWECDNCGAEFETADKSGIKVYCPVCGTDEHERARDGLSSLELIDMRPDGFLPRETEQ